MKIKPCSGVISVDLGTSSIRACFIDPNLNIIHSEQKSVKISTDADGKAEQDPIEIITAALDCIKNVGKWAQESDLSAVALCFSNAVSSLVCLGDGFHPIRPMMTYADLRAHLEAKELKSKFDFELFSKTACPIHASYWLPKLLWLQNNGFSLSNCTYFCTIKDFLIYKLTGHFVTDFSNAVATGMCNVISKDWDHELLHLIDIKKEQLPNVLSTTDIIKPKNCSLIEELNLAADIQIVVGATDGVLSSLGAGAFNSGQVTTMIGSSGACRIAAESPLIGDQETRTWSYPLTDDVWIRGGAMNSGGLVTQWFADNFIQSTKNLQSIDQALELAGSIDAGSDGLIFLPYLFGERAPIWDEKARGVFFGIHGSHELAHFARASFEGILFALYSVFETLNPDLEGKIEVRSTGGFVRSPLMLQIQSDIFKLPIHVPANYEGSSVGAAALAYKAVGIYSSFDQVSALISIDQIFYPNKLTSNIYIEEFEKFKTIYQSLKTIY